MTQSDTQKEGCLPSVINSFINPKNGKHYVVRRLSGEQDVLLSLGLQDRVVAALPVEKQNQIIKRTAEYFSLMQGKKGIMLGVFAENGQLVAHGVLGLPHSKDDAMVLGRGEFGFPFGVRELSDIGVLQCMHTDPDENGLGHAGCLVDARLDVLKSLGCRHAICKIASTNIRSYALYAKREAVVFSLDYLADEGVYLFGIHKPLVRPYIFCTEEREIFFNIYQDIEKIQSYLNPSLNEDGTYSRKYVGKLLGDDLFLYRVSGAHIPIL